MHRISISHRCLIFFAAGIALFNSRATAQVLEDMPLIDLEFRVFSLNREPIKDLYYRAETNSMRLLEFASRHRSILHDYRGPEIISFYRKINSPTPDAVPYQIVGSVNLSSITKDPLLFFLPLNGEGSSYRILAMEDSPDRFPYGHIRILNASGSTLTGKVGDQDVTL